MDDPGADLARERGAFLQRARAAGADGVEDYIGWAVVETKPGQWDWSLYQENAREIRKAGLKYVPYVWVQNLPSWVRHGADYRFATCLEHGKTTEALSIFSPKTVEAYDRVFAQLKAALGTQIDALRIGSPSDYGETHYPAGNASQAFPVAHIHMGWWAQEPEAQQHFRRWVEKKYGSVDRLNAAWGTQFTGFAFDYPRDPTSPRRWLDFVEWYHEALIERLGVLFDVARKHFPETPICVNLGWPFEKIVLGQDLSGLVKMLASKGMIVRSPSGPMVTHLYTRRVATAARVLPRPEALDGTDGRLCAAQGNRGSPVQGPHDRRPGTSTISITWSGRPRRSSTRDRCRVTTIPASTLPFSSPRPHTGWRTGSCTRGSRGATPRAWPPGWKDCATSWTTTSWTND